MESEKKYRTETHHAGYLVVVSNGVEIETRKACEERDTWKEQNFITFTIHVCYTEI